MFLQKHPLSGEDPAPTTAPAAADTASRGERRSRRAEEESREAGTEKEYSRQEREPIPKQERDSKGVWRAGCDTGQQGSLDCNSAHLLHKDSGKPLFFLSFFCLQPVTAEFMIGCY